MSLSYPFSAILVSWDMEPSYKRAFVTMFLSCADIGHTTIEDLYANEGYNLDSLKDLYVHDIVRMRPITNNGDHFDNIIFLALRLQCSPKKCSCLSFGVRTLSELPCRLHEAFMPKDRIEALDLPAVDLEMTWFGGPPETILVQAIAGKKTPNDVHVVGEKVLVGDHQ